MAFPVDPLDVTVGLAFGADPAADPATFTFTDVTADNRARVVIRRGRQNEGGERVEPGRCSLRFGNDGGTYTPYNPASIRWPNIRPDTPIQVMAASSVRATQFVADWRPGFADGGGGPWEGAPICDVEAGGVLRRLGQGTPQALSPMRRSIAASSPVAYWPIEDGGDAGQVGSALAGHPAMSVSGTVTFQPVQDWQDWVTPGGKFQVASLAAADLQDGGTLRGSIPASATAAMASAWTISCLSRNDIGDTASGNVVLMEWTTPGGTFARWQLVVTTTSHSQVIAYDSAGAATTVVDHFGTTGAAVQQRVSATQNGGNIDVSFYTFSNNPDATGSVAGTLAGPATIAGNATGVTNTDPVPFGHLVLWASADPTFEFANFTDSYGATVKPSQVAFGNEAAHDRISRLCAEEGITLTVSAVSADFVTRMGPQPIGTLLDLLRECAEADQGVLYETIAGGLGYLPREWLYNRPVDLPAQRGHLTPGFGPTADDQTTRNRVTVSRPGGSSATAEDAEHIAARGLYKHSITINVDSDGVLLDHAAWRVHLGTVEELRYPKITLNLHADPDLIPAWLACDIGSRITIANAPASMPPGLIDLIIDGYVETLDAFEWTVELNCSPASPWDVGVWGTSRYDTLGSELAAAFVAGTGTSMSVAVTEGPLWRTGAVDFDVRAGGVVLHVTSIAGAVSPQTFTVDATPVNGVARTIPVGEPVRLANPARYAL